jgi:hypothetical protein
MPATNARIARPRRDNMRKNKALLWEIVVEAPMARQKLGGASRNCGRTTRSLREAA